MPFNRRDFMKKSCMAGVCLCGFGGIMDLTASTGRKEDTKKESVHSKWITSLLLAIKDESPETARKIIKQNSQAHFDDLNLKETLAPFKGNLESFFKFLSEEWGWKINYDKENNIVTADENKNYCVCPLIQNKKINGLGALCYCSEGIAEKMFSYVTGHEAKAEVKHTVLRGSETCIYKIILSAE